MNPKLKQALDLEEARLALSLAHEDFWGSDADVAMHFQVHALCKAAGITLYDYDDKDTNLDIMRGNIAQIKGCAKSVLAMLLEHPELEQEFPRTDLAEFPLESACGKACVEVVNTWAEVRDAFPDAREHLAAAVIKQCEVICFG